MCETASSWEWFQLEGNDEYSRHMLRSSFTSQFRWGPRSIMDISIFHILRSSVSLERASRKRERGGGGVSKRRSEKIRVVFEQVSLPSSSQYPTPGAIEQPATWLTVSQTIVQMFANRLWTCATCIPLSLRPCIEIDRTEIADCIQSVRPISRINLSFFFKKNSTSSTLLRIPR